MRLFVAAEIPASLRADLEAVQGAMRKDARLPVRWVRPETVHLTLKFLGEVPQPRLDTVVSAFAGAARRIPPFRLEAAGAAAFPGRGAPRLIWVEVGGEIEAAARLASAIDAAAAAIGFPRETRPFRPHLTLGRVKGPGRGNWRSTLEAVAGRARGVFEVREFVLFESHLDPEGAVHVPLKRFPLDRGTGAGGAP